MSSVFGQTSSAVFGPGAQPQTGPPPPGTGLFGSSTQPPAAPTPAAASALFGSSTQLPPGTGLFGSSTQPPAAPTPAAASALFGSSTQPPPGTGLFGSSTQAPAGTGLFGSTAPPPTQNTGSGLFGSTQSQSQIGGGLFGSAQPAPQGTGLFGSTLGSTLPAQQQQQQQQTQQQILGQSGLLNQSEIAPRTKSVTEQIELVFSKWNPMAPTTPFRTYLYNAIPETSVPFYGPSPIDDEAKWEEALAKRPTPGSIPILVRGFQELGTRMKSQYVSLEILRGRLHEINNGLNTLLQKHDLHISIRAAECRRRHQKLARQCLLLASKTQVLRNRGFAMDSAEETLRQKLMVLERSVVDPALNGRSEEIWARMVSTRERVRQLQREFERAGQGVQPEGGVVDEEVMKRVRKILEDYSSQLVHLTKELAQINKDWAEWEAGEGARR